MGRQCKTNALARGRAMLNPTTTRLRRSFPWKLMRRVRRHQSGSNRKVTKDEIELALQHLGLPKGATVLVHCSLSSLGLTIGEEGMIIDVILDAVGEEGTVVMPTFTYRTVTRDKPFFDVKRTRSELGWTSESFRLRHGAFRSLHPTHSFAAIGAKAEYITRNHENSPTPCDRSSPLGKLIQLDGYTLLMGVGEEADSLHHAIEEWLDIPHRFGEQEVAFHVTGNQGEERIVHTKMHGPIPNRRNFERLFLKEGVMREAKIGSASVRLGQARGMVDIVSKVLADNPYRFFENPTATLCWSICRLWHSPSRKYIPALLCIQFVARPAFQAEKIVSKIRDGVKLGWGSRVESGNRGDSRNDEQ